MKLSYTLGLLAGVSTFSASALGAPSPLTWEEVKASALALHPGLRAAAVRQEGAAAAVKESVGTFLPDISVSARRTRAESRAGAGALVESKSTNFSAAASLNLFAGFSHWGALGRARAGGEEAAAHRDLTSVGLRYELRRAYFQLSVKQDQISLLEKILHRKEQNQKLVSIKYDSGAEARWNVQKAQADSELAAYNLQLARNELAILKVELSRLIQRDSLEGPVASPDYSLLTAAAPTDGALASLHPQLRRTLAAEKKLDYDRTLARSAYFPSVDLSYGQSRDRSENGARLETRSNSVSLSASWSLFNGFSDYQRVQQANLSLQAAQLEREQEARTIASNLQSAALALKITSERIAPARSLRIAAEARLRTVSAQYRAGLKTYLDWEQAENQLVESEQDEVSAGRSALLALTDYERAAGRTLEEP